MVSPESDIKFNKKFEVTTQNGYLPDTTYL